MLPVRSSAVFRALELSHEDVRWSVTSYPLSPSVVAKVPYMH